jgi:hypothetical protein
VEDPRVIRLTVELELVGPLHGRVGPIDGPLETFTGWIGLAAALDRRIRDGQPPSSTGQPPDGIDDLRQLR